MQAAFEASRHANRCRDEAEARAASLEGQLLACQRDAARMKAEVQAVSSRKLSTVFLFLRATACL